MSTAAFRSECELVESQFFSIYLTIIALIQSISLAFAVQTFATSFNPDYLPRYVIVFLLIFTVWHHYMYGVLYLRWFPRFWDSAIPFALGFSEMLLIWLCAPSKSIETLDLALLTRGYSSTQAWLSILTVVAAAGTLAYLHTCWRIAPELLSQRMSLADARAHCRCIRVSYIWVIALSGFQGVWAGWVTYLALKAGAHGAVPNLNRLTWVCVALLMLHIVVFEYLVWARIRPSFIACMRRFSAVSVETKVEDASH